QSQLHLLQWGPAEEQPLLPDAGEPNDRFGLVARPFDVEDDAIAVLGVAHIVAYPKAERLGPMSLRSRRGCHRALDDLFAVAADRRRPTARTDRRGSLPIPRVARSFGVLGERIGDLVEE